MSMRRSKPPRIVAILAQSSLLILAAPAIAQLGLGVEELVRAGEVPSDVPGYSVPSFVHWDDDGKKDLVVGEGSGSSAGKVRVYLNVGTASAPEFSTYLLAQSNGSDLTVPGSG